MPRAVLILNRASGGSEGADPIALARPFAERGWRVRTRVVDPAQVDRAVAEGVAQAPDALIIGGGDGTLRTAAGRIAGTGIALGVLPLGTMNLVAKDLGLPASPGEAAQSLAGGQVSPVDVAEVNGEVYLHSALLGLAPDLAREREEVRAGESALEGLRAMYHGLRRTSGARRLVVGLKGDTWETVARTWLLAITCNEVTNGLARERLDAGRLGVVWSTHTGRLGLAQLALGVATGAWNIDPAFRRGSSTAVRLETGARSLTLTADGELLTLDEPLHFRSRPGALRVLRPATTS